MKCSVYVFPERKTLSCEQMRDVIQFAWYDGRITRVSTRRPFAGTNSSGSEMMKHF